MINKNATNSYMQQQITTSSNAKVVAMMFDKAIFFINDALEHLKNNDPAKRWKSNDKAQKIIMHLHNMLDLEKGGIMAENLDRLYATILFELPKIDIKGEAKYGEDAIRLLTPLRDSWYQLAKQIEEGAVDIEAEMRKALNETDGQKLAAPAQSSYDKKPSQQQESLEDRPRSTFSTSA